MKKKTTNTKVSMRTLIGVQILPAISLVVYYWMWARVYHWNEFQSSYYSLIQNVITIFSGGILFLLIYVGIKYKKETPDELAANNLLRVNSISFKFLCVILIIASFAAVILNLPGWVIGYILVATILLVTIMRVILFWIMDTRGI